jgi:hypothetical protein
MQCHSVVPRLNYVGNKFRAAGFRMPWEIGKDQDDSTLKLENYTAFRAELNAPLQVQVDRAVQNTTTNLTTSAEEIAVHPITGSFGKYWGSGFELDASTSGTVNLSQAFLTSTVGSANSFGSAQIGVTKNLPVYSILQPPDGVSAPLVLSTSASNPALDTTFNWLDPRAAGLTLSYWLEDTHLSASVRDRLLKKDSGLDSQDGINRMGDVLLSATQYLDHTGGGSALSIFYYKGLSRVPTKLGGSTLYGNSFNHLGIAANKYLSERYNVFAGGGWNADQGFNVNTGTPDQTLHSFGTFAGLEEFWSPTLMAGIRFDQFRTDVDTQDSNLLGAAIYFSTRVTESIILSAEYQYQYNEKSTSIPVGVNAGLGSVDQHTLLAHAMVIF